MPLQEPNFHQGDRAGDHKGPPRRSSPPSPLREAKPLRELMPLGESKPLREPNFSRKDGETAPKGYGVSCYSRDDRLSALLVVSFSVLYSLWCLPLAT